MERLSVGERFRSGFVTLGALESQFDYTLDKEASRKIGTGKNMLLDAKIADIDVRVEERHGQLYVQVMVVRDLTDLPEEQKACRCKEQFIFSKNVDHVDEDGMEDLAEDMGKAVAQIMMLGTLSFVSGQRLQSYGWLLEIEQPVMYHKWEALK